MRPVLLVFLTGCAAPPLDGAATILLSQSARDAGYALDLGDEPVDLALPRVVDAALPLRLVSPDGDLRLDLRPATAVWVRVGADGQPEVQTREIGGEVAPDAIRVVGSEAAALDLADQIGAEILGQAQRTWLLVGGDALLLASVAEETPGLDRALYVDAEEALPDALLVAAGLASPEAPQGRPGAKATRRAWLGAEGQRWASQAESSAGTRDLGLGAGSGLQLTLDAGRPGLADVRYVGLYCAEGDQILLNAEGGYSTARLGLGAVQGHWAVGLGEVVLQPWQDEPLTLRLDRDNALVDDADQRYDRADCLSPALSAPRSAP